MTNKIKSPYKDFYNYEISEGDVMQHPSGEKGTVVFEKRTESDSDNWLIEYEDGVKSRLCLQVGEKGQAFVLQLDNMVEIRENAPEGATHYKLTIKGSVRYYTKDWNDSWGIYQDWKYPIGWKKVTNFFDDIDLKPL